MSSCWRRSSEIAAMGTLEQAHQRKLLKEHTARLDYLELKMAREGYDTDPATLTEVDQIRASIARLKDALEAPLPEKTVQALTPDDRYQGNVAWQMRVEGWMYKIDKRMDASRQWDLITGALLLVVTTVLIMLILGMAMGIV